jgi:signal transduction histidine kinase/CheY-like chemotaxis protein
MAPLAATLARGGPPPAPLARLIGATALADEQVALVVCVADKATPYDDTDRRELQLLTADLWAIVQRRRTELALGEAKVAADAANLAKSAFLANMSHEIRTPMNAIVGFAHLLRRDPLTARQQDHLGKITDAGQHLLQVINDILDFSKIEAHKVTLEEADFDLRESLLRVQALQADAARAKRLPLRLHIDARCPARVRGDPLRLEQVLLNLLSNAVKFTQQGHIELRVAPAGPPEPESVLRFEVVDTGIGMTREQAAQVFEAFAQADASTTRRFGGTGLGLAISKRLVQLMQGRIGVDSRPGEGSTFRVQLPLPPAGGTGASVPAPALASPVPAGLLRGKRILLAEDNPVNQEVAGTLLSALGAEVDLAATGREAVDRFAAGRHDLVLMDVQMPGMDGLSATAVIRSLPEGQKVPIVAMTANAFAEDRARCLAAGMNDHLAKPVEPRALEQCLLRWLAVAAPAAPAPPPAPSADERLRPRLEQLDVIDTTGALARLRGSWPLYLRMLHMFVSHHGGDDARLADGARAGDGKALRELAHALAGAAASIGATEVMQQARALQTAMKPDSATAPSADSATAPSGDSALPLIDALQRCLHGLRAALAQADEAPPAQPSDAAPARAAVREALLALQPLLAAHDTAALALFERHRAHIEGALGPDGRVLGEHLRNFSFGAAQACLVQALALVDDQAA